MMMLSVCLAALMMGACHGSGPGERPIDARAALNGSKVIAFVPYYRSAPSGAVLDRLSHANYFSVTPNANGTLDTSNVNAVALQQLVTEAHSRGVQVMITVGGWGLSAGFSALAATPSTRSVFVDAIFSFVSSYGLDGVDLDWEFPTASDGANYVALLADLRAAIDGAHPAAAGKTLTIDLPANGWHGQHVPSGVFTHVDWANIMSYDDFYTGDPDPNHASWTKAMAHLSYWAGRGLPASKTVLGLPFYGRSPSLGYAAIEYHTLVSQYAPGNASNEAGGYYYNGPDLIAAKTQHVVDNGMAGVMFWEFWQDVSDPSASTSLLGAIVDSVQQGCTVNADCDDSIFCNGSESCSSGSCLAGTDPCPGQICDEAGQLCSQPPVCNDDGICDAGEDCGNCPGDCGASAACGNGVCEAGDGEDCVSCPADCNGKVDGPPKRRFCCGDGDGPKPLSCAESRCDGDGWACTDAPAGGLCCALDAECDDGLFCNGPESCVAGGCEAGSDPCAGQSCDEAADQCITPVCNDNGICEAGEDCHNCAADCWSANGGASCGNGICEAGDGEDCLSCSQDCRGKTNGPKGGRYCCGYGDGTGPLSCSDGLCTTDGYSCTDTPASGGSCCGDGVCSGGEATSNCALDC